MQKRNRKAGLGAKKKKRGRRAPGRKVGRRVRRIMEGSEKGEKAREHPATRFNWSRSLSLSLSLSVLSEKVTLIPSPVTICTIEIRVFRELSFSLSLSLSLSLSRPSLFSEGFRLRGAQLSDTLRKLISRTKISWCLKFYDDPPVNYPPSLCWLSLRRF